MRSYRNERSNLAEENPSALLYFAFVAFVLALIVTAILLGEARKDTCVSRLIDRGTPLKDAQHACSR